MAVDKYKIFEELDYLLASYSFRNKPQIQRLLRYLVEHARDDSDLAFDQRAIAVECLGRGGDFDPAENPVVRIEIGRLRKLLNHFYSEEPSRYLRISIPLGQYRPVISEQQKNEVKAVVPELVIPPSQPESLSLLLQFEIDGEESPDLYLLRHQIRIGLTVNIGKLNGVRLLVALPNEDGNIASHVDFIVRVSVGNACDAYQLYYSVIAKESGLLLFKEQISLPKPYEKKDLDQLICLWGTDLLDREIGLLWVEWVSLRNKLENDNFSHVGALVHFQKYLLNQTITNLETAFLAISKAQREDPTDSLMNTILSELYYRLAITGSDIVQNPVRDGLLLVRKSLRSNPACPMLHRYLAFMLFFSREFDVAEIELSLCLKQPIPTFSCRFHSLVLLSLMSGTDDGLEQLKSLCEQAGVYPQLYVVMLYLNSILNRDDEMAATLRKDLDEKATLPMLLQCILYMRMPLQREEAGAKEQFKKDVLQHFSQFS